MRLGFAVKVLGKAGLKSNDSRRWQNNPHLRVSIEYLHAIFDYLDEPKISMYRISSDFAPYVTHPDLPQFHRQIEECENDLKALGKRANEMNLRLSFHPSQYIVLNSPNPKLTETSSRDFLAQATMLDVMEQGDEAVVVTHVGGVYGEREAARERFIQNYKALPEPARRRLVLENDDVSWGVDDVLRIHEATGIRCIFDHQHHNCIHPDGLDAVEACCAMLSTWPGGVRPKIHFSSPRVARRIVERKDRATGKKIQAEVAPLASQHDDYVEVSTFLPFARAVTKHVKQKQQPFDVMIEAKAKDLALIKLREELKTLAPEIAVE